MEGKDTWFLFNIDRDRRIERRLAIRVRDDGSLGATMYTGSGDVRGHAVVLRPDRTYLRVQFRPRALKPHLSSYSWRVVLVEPEQGSEPPCCTEKAPNRGAITHHL
jgi:hypothetical protein